MAGYRGRFAPSPTGLLHLGSAATALVAAARARAASGAFVLRIEDLDTPRVVAGAEAALLEDLAWLGVRWSEGPSAAHLEAAPDAGPHAPYRQSQRTKLYEAALDDLAAHGLTYLCDCSRAEIAAVASAPHAGDEGPRYPGTCRAFGMRERAYKRAPAVRLAVPEGSRVTFVDGIAGATTEDVFAQTGDFVLRRGDGVFAYQLAVVVDDLAMGVTEVVRGRDLLGSTARQIVLAQMLGGAAPAFAHVPLVTAANGERLAKRAPGVTLRDQRASGRTGRDVACALARALGVEVADDEDAIDALASRLDVAALRSTTLNASTLALPRS